MRLNSYGQRDRVAAMATNDPRVRVNSILLQTWANSTLLALKPEPAIIQRTFGGGNNAPGTGNGSAN